MTLRTLLLSSALSMGATIAQGQVNKNTTQPDPLPEQQWRRVDSIAVSPQQYQLVYRANFPKEKNDSVHKDLFYTRWIEEGRVVQQSLRAEYGTEAAVYQFNGDLVKSSTAYLVLDAPPKNDAKGRRVNQTKILSGTGLNDEKIKPKERRSQALREAKEELFVTTRNTAVLNTDELRKFIANAKPVCEEKVCHNAFIPADQAVAKPVVTPTKQNPSDAPGPSL